MILVFVSIACMKIYVDHCSAKKQSYRLNVYGNSVFFILQR